MEAIVVLVVCLVSAFWSSHIATTKGRSAGLFWFLGFVLPVVALVVIYFVNPVQYRPGQIVQTIVKVNLDDGTRIPTGWRSTVHAVSVIDNTRVVSISDSAGVRRWVAAKAIKLSN